jgi:hypothetical protein
VEINTLREWTGLTLTLTVTGGQRGMDPNMKPKTAKKEFERFIKESSKTRDALTPAEGIQLVLDFYRQVRAEDCIVP